VVNVSNKDQSYSIILDDGSRQAIDRKFLLDNFFNFLFYREQKAEATKNKIEKGSKDKYFRNRELKEFLTRAKNTGRFTREEKKKYRNFLRDTLEELLKDKTLSKKRIKDSGIPADIKEFIQDEPLEKLLDDNFIFKITPVQRKLVSETKKVKDETGKEKEVVIPKQIPKGSMPKAERERLQLLADGLGDDLEKYVLEGLKITPNKITFDGSLISGNLNKKERLDKVVGVFNQDDPKRDKRTGKFFNFFTGNIASGQREIRTIQSDVSDEDAIDENEALTEINAILKKQMEGLKLLSLSKEDLKRPVSRENNIYSEYLDALEEDDFTIMIEDEFLMPLHTRLIVKKKEEFKEELKTLQRMSDDDITSEQRDRMRTLEDLVDKSQKYEEWKDEHSVEIEVFIKNVRQYFGSIINGLFNMTELEQEMDEASGPLMAKNPDGTSIPEEEIPEEDKEKYHLAKHKFLGIRQFLSKIKLPQRSGAIIKEKIAEFIETFDDIQERITTLYKDGHTGIDGNETTLGKIFAKVKGRTDVSNDDKKYIAKEIINWNKQKLGDILNDLDKVVQITFDLKKKKVSAAVVKRYNVTMGQRLATSSKTNFATSETTVPLPLLTKFNSMINLFRANTRRAKRTLR